MELGITTFAETAAPPGVDVPGHGERLREVLEEIDVAEQVGLDVYAVGEHHRADFAASAPEIVLAAAAGRTSRIRLSSAVTVLSSADPVRVYQDFATLDLLSEGRAEIIAGRGSFTESFPLFGYDLDDYDDLFDEKLALLVAIRDHESVTWQGRHRPALHNQRVYPRAQQDPLPIWVGVGGTPESVVRAARHGLPLTLAIIGGSPRRFTGFADLHRRALAEYGKDPQPVSVNGHGFVARNPTVAKKTFYPSYAEVMTRIGRERGFGAMTPQAFEAMLGPEGNLVLGSPEQVAEKILDWRRWLGIERYMMHVSVGTMPHKDVLTAIELLGTQVAPLVREAIATEAGNAVGEVGSGEVST